MESRFQRQRLRTHNFLGATPGCHERGAFGAQTDTQPVVGIQPRRASQSVRLADKDA